MTCVFVKLLYDLHFIVRIHIVGDETVVEDFLRIEKSVIDASDPDYKQVIEEWVPSYQLFP